MRAKTILTVLFLVSIGVAAFAILYALPQRVDPEAQTSEILVAAVPLAAGTLLRAHDVIWHPFPVIRTNLPAAQCDAHATVRAYKRLSGVEHAFRSLKTVDLELFADEMGATLDLSPAA